MKKVYVVRVDDVWADSNIEAVYEDEKKAYADAVNLSMSRWNPEDNDLWRDYIENEHQYVPQEEYVEMMIKEGEWWIKVEEYELK